MESSNEEEKLDSINRIVLLEKAVQELGRPWYKQALTVISGLALIVSIASALFTYISKHTEDMRSKREELRNIMSNIIDSRFDRSKVQNSEEFFMKQGLYIESAEVLINEFPEKVSYQEYLVMEKEMYYYGNNKKAEDYGEKAIKAASKSILSKNIALRLVAELYFYPSIRDFGKGRKYFQQAADLLANINDNYIIQNLAITYEMWGLNELRNSFVAEGNQKIELARKYYTDLEHIGFIMGAIKSMEENVKTATPNLSPSSSDLRPWVPSPPPPPPGIEDTARKLRGKSNKPK